MKNCLQLYQHDFLSLLLTLCLAAVINLQILIEWLLS